MALVLQFPQEGEFRCVPLPLDMRTGGSVRSTAWIP